MTQEEINYMPDKIAVWRFEPSLADEWIHGGWSEDHDRKTTAYIKADCIKAQEEINELRAEIWEQAIDAAIAKVRAFNKEFRDHGNLNDAIVSAMCADHIQDIPNPYKAT